jgi:MFS transporter, NNP family, nitrate/nitrite transporter
MRSVDYKRNKRQEQNMLHAVVCSTQRTGGIVREIIRAIRSGHWPSLVAAWLHFEVSFMAWLLIGALGIFIAEEFHLTATQKGLLVAVPLLGGAILRIPAGLCSDWFGPKPTGLVLLAGESLVLLWGWSGVSNYTELLTMGLCLGIAGASFAVSLPLASRAYPPVHQGLAMGVAASANSGIVLAAFLAPLAGQVVGWQGVFGLMAAPVLITLVLFSVLVRRDIGDASSACGAGGWDHLSGLLREPFSYWLCFLYAVTFGGFAGLSSFLPIFLHDHYSLDVVTAGSVTALCGLAGSLIRPWGGYIADRAGGKAVLAWVFPVMAGLVIVVGAFPPLAWAIPVLVLAVASMGFGNGVVFRIVSDRYPKQMGTASGLIGAAGGLGGFLLPTWLGVLKDAIGTYRGGFLLFAALAGAAWISIFLMNRRPGIQ